MFTSLNTVSLKVWKKGLELIKPANPPNVLLDALLNHMINSLHLKKEF